jgi:hypothetical protein
MEQDIADLLQILMLRFGTVPDDVRDALSRLTDVQMVNRLILVAANAADLGTFRHELAQGPTAFRI